MNPMMSNTKTNKRTKKVSARKNVSDSKLLRGNKHAVQSSATKNKVKVDDATQFDHGKRPRLKKKDLTPTQQATLDEQKARGASNCSCLVHGLPPHYAAQALKKKKLTSAYSREGPNGDYKRTSDRLGGGALGVYTRSVGKDQDWPAKGQGVGSGEGKVQFVMSPEVLEQPGHEWRANSTDGMGFPPGATKAMIPPTNERNGVLEDGRQMWEHQTEADRAAQFDASVSGGVMANNEQLHYENVPLKGTLKAITCSDKETFDDFVRESGAKMNDAPPPTGMCVDLDGEKIPVLLVNPDASLVATLQDAGVADPQGRVR